MLILLVLSCCLPACARIRGLGDDEFRYAKSLSNEKRYTDAIGVYDKIARESAGTKRGANALYFSASTLVFYDNPNKNYTQSLQEFDEFLRVYPNDERADDAQNWRHIIKVIVELKKENERLNKSIEQLKNIDIRHEERRKH